MVAYLQNLFLEKEKNGNIVCVGHILVENGENYITLLKESFFQCINSNNNNENNNNNNNNNSILAV